MGRHARVLLPLPRTRLFTRVRRTFRQVPPLNPAELPQPASPTPLITLFGAISVRDGSGQLVEGVMAGSKRLALLAYLACAPADRPVRRDVLLALLWPESDDRRARGALRNVVHQLRQALGHRALVSQGDGDLSLAAELRTDARQFAEAVEHGDLAGAVECYAGPFLHGFHLAGSPDFERWVDSERRRFAEEAGRAARRLAGDALSIGDVAAAVRWSRRECEILRGDDAAARRLIALLAESGDGDAALRAYDELRAELAATLELPPSAETAALVRRIREERDRRAPGAGGEAAPPPPPSARGETAAPTGLAPAVPPGAPSPRHGDPSPRRAPSHWSRLRPRLVPLLMLAGALAVVIGATQASRTGSRRLGRAADGSQPTLAVLPFAVTGDRSVAYLREGLPRLLGSVLDVPGAFVVMDPAFVLRSSGDSVAEGAALASRLGARYYVDGSVVEAGGRVRIDAGLYDRGVAAPLPVARAITEGPADSVFHLVDEMAVELLGARFGARGTFVSRTATRYSASLPALRQFLAGEAAMRQRRYDDAAEAFARAVRFDTSFALAYYGVAVASDFAANHPVEYDALARALQLVDRLAPRERDYVLGFAYGKNGPVDSALAVYRRLVARYPYDAEAWFQLGDVLFHQGPPMGIGFATSREALERALALDPSDHDALVHLARIAAWDGDQAQLGMLVERALATGPRDVELEAYRALAAGLGADDARVLAFARHATPTAVFAAVWRLMAYAHALPDAFRVAYVLLDPGRPAADQLLGLFTLAEVEMARGRFRSARAFVARIEPMDPAIALLLRAQLVLHPDAPATTAERREILQALRRWPATRPPRSDVGAFGPEARNFPWYLTRDVARLAVAVGDTEALAALSDAEVRLERASPWNRALGTWRTALALARRGARADAIDRLRDGSSYRPDWIRWELATWLERDGRREEAASWYGTLGGSTIWEATLVPSATLRLARLAAREGHPDAARREYERVVTMWAQCDPELRPLLEEARRGAAADAP